MELKRPEYIDTHAHTNFIAFDDDRREVVERALRNNTWMINIGTMEKTSEKAVDMTREFPEGVFAIVGLHPIHANASHHDIEELGGEGKAFTSRGETFNTDFYRSLINLAPKGKVVGIGECGLDYYQELDAEALKRQKTAFRAQIELALEFDLPLMLHVRSSKDGARNAYRDVLHILREYKTVHGDRLRGQAHFFAGSVSELEQFIDLGFYVSFTGVVTFAKQYEELVKAAPHNRILSETDCPYVAPVPHRGKRNEPFFLSHVADKLAQFKNMDKAVLVDNAFDLYKL